MTDENNTGAAQPVKRHGRAAHVGLGTPPAKDSARLLGRLERLNQAVTDLEARDEPPLEKITELRAEIDVVRADITELAAGLQSALAPKPADPATPA